MKKKINCPVCSVINVLEKKDFYDQSQPQKYALFECQNCLTQFWNPLKHPGSEYYEDEKFSIYNDFHSGRDISLVFQDVRFVKFLNEFNNQKNKQILEIGCSDGLLLSHLSSLGNEVWGVDLDSIAIDIAKSRKLQNIYCAKLEEFIADCEDKQIKFDYILAFDVIEHLTNPKDVIQKLKDLLNDGGRIIGTVPNRNRWFADFVETDFPPHHFYRFNLSSLNYLLNSCNLVVKNISTFEYGYTLKTLFLHLFRDFRKSKDTVTKNPKIEYKSITYSSSNLKRNFLSILRYLSVLCEYPFKKDLRFTFQVRKTTSLKNNSYTVVVK